MVRIAKVATFPSLNANKLCKPNWADKERPQVFELLTGFGNIQTAKTITPAKKSNALQVVNIMPANDNSL